MKTRVRTTLWFVVVTCVVAVNTMMLLTPREVRADGGCWAWCDADDSYVYCPKNGRFCSAADNVGCSGYCWVGILEERHLEFCTHRCSGPEPM